MRRFPLLMSLASVSLTACAQTGMAGPASAGTAPAISEATLTTLTQTLSSDAFEGRAPTTPGEEKTVKLIAERFAQAGLQPGNAGSWFQEVPLAETVSTPTVLTISGGSAPLRFAYRTDMVANTYRLQPKVELKDSPIVFVGYGIDAPERGWNDYQGLDVRGKTVIILVNDPDWQAAQGPFGGKAMTYYGRWTYKYEEAARKGAAAAFIVHDTAPASYGWNVVQSSWTGAQYNMDDANGHADQSAVIGWLTQEAARTLMADSGLDLAQLTAAAKQKGFKAVPLKSRASVSLTNQIKRAKSRNVIGILPGTTRPDEYVIHTAHWDHIGRCDANAEGDDICNGAVDNASGTAGLIALAEAHAKAGPAERSLVFLAVTAEESGLLGSRYYGENPIFPHARTVGGVNMDGLNIEGLTRDFVVIGSGKSEIENWLRRAAPGLQIKDEPTPEAGYYYRSDHFSLAKFGVPMLYAKSGEDLVQGGVVAGRAAAAAYRADRYHGPNDEFDPNWDWSGAVRDLGIYYQVGRGLAESEAWPNWREGDEFRQIRDRSRGAVQASR